jgi:hypothetical protein
VKAHTQGFGLAAAQRAQGVERVLIAPADTPGRHPLDPGHPDDDGTDGMPTAQHRKRFERLEICYK